jgi:phage tail-like protein
MPEDRRDYFTLHNFNVEIDGVVQAGFKEVEGLDSVTEVIEYKDGDDMTVHKRPGRTKYSNIILRRGFINDPAFWEWRKSVIEGRVQRKSGSIVIFNDANEEVMRYNFYEAWPCSWKGPKLDASGRDVTVEEVELVVERIERA